MTINTRDELISALGNNSSRLVIDKASIANAAVGQFHSLWRATGQPGQGATPSAAASCNNALLGAFQFTQQTAPVTTYGAYLEMVTSNSATVIELHDRLAHLGGLVGNVATLQAASLDLTTMLATDNLDARKGDTNYSDVQWWLEWYSDTGATSGTVTVSVKYNDDTTGTLSGAYIGSTRRASFMLPLNGLVPAASSGKYIAAVTGVQLAATTGTAGNFGVTATRPRMTIGCPLANYKSVSDWASLGLPEIYNNSCIFPIALCSTTSTGTVRGGGKLAHG